MSCPHRAASELDVWVRGNSLDAAAAFRDTSVAWTQNPTHCPAGRTETTEEMANEHRSPISYRGRFA
jgi:hypothetical protein